MSREDLLKAKRKARRKAQRNYVLPRSTVRTVASRSSGSTANLNTAAVITLNNFISGMLAQ